MDSSAAAASDTSTTFVMRIFTHRPENLAPEARRFLVAYLKLVTFGGNSFALDPVKERMAPLLASDSCEMVGEVLETLVNPMVELSPAEAESLGTAWDHLAAAYLEDLHALDTAASSGGSPFDRALAICRDSERRGSLSRGVSVCRIARSLLDMALRPGPEGARSSMPVGPLFEVMARELAAGQRSLLQQFQCLQGGLQAMSSQPASALPHACPEPDAGMAVDEEPSRQPPQAGDTTVATPLMEDSFSSSAPAGTSPAEARPPSYYHPRHHASPLYSSEYGDPPARSQVPPAPGPSSQPRSALSWARRVGGIPGVSLPEGVPPNQALGPVFDLTPDTVRHILRMDFIAGVFPRPEIRLLREDPPLPPCIMSLYLAIRYALSLKLRRPLSRSGFLSLLPAGDIPGALLSRDLAACLIACLPPSPPSAREIMFYLLPVLPHEGSMVILARQMAMALALLGVPVSPDDFWAALRLAARPDMVDAFEAISAAYRSSIFFADFPEVVDDSSVGDTCLAPLFGLSLPDYLFSSLR